jgi:hypothetical protein
VGSGGGGSTAESVWIERSDIEAIGAVAIGADRVVTLVGALRLNLSGGQDPAIQADRIIVRQANITATATGARMFGAGVRPEDSVLTVVYGTAAIERELITGQSIIQFGELTLPSAFVGPWAIIFDEERIVSFDPAMFRGLLISISDNQPHRAIAFGGTCQAALSSSGEYRFNASATDGFYANVIADTCRTISLSVPRSQSPQETTSEAGSGVDTTALAIGLAVGLSAAVAIVVAVVVFWRRARAKRRPDSALLEFPGSYDSAPHTDLF